MTFNGITRMNAFFFVWCAMRESRFGISQSCLSVYGADVCVCVWEEGRGMHSMCLFPSNYLHDNRICTIPLSDFHFIHS